MLMRFGVLVRVDQLGGLIEVLSQSATRLDTLPENSRDVRYLGGLMHKL